MTFGYLWILLAVCVEQLIMGHAYDEYFVLVYKPGMTIPLRILKSRPSITVSMVTI
jgi:hypothetical protein